MQLDHMTNEERKIYDMVVRRFLSVLYPPFVYEQVSMEGIVAGELFAASGKVVKSAGWKDVYENTDDTEEDEDTADDAQKLKDQKLPQMKKGERLHIENVSMNTGRTKPPARFTEATLLAEWRIRCAIWRVMIQRQRKLSVRQVVWGQLPQGPILLRNCLTAF